MSTTVPIHYVDLELALPSDTSEYDQQAIALVARMMLRDVQRRLTNSYPNLIWRER